MTNSEIITQPENWLHDAEIWGDTSADIADFLERPLTFMTGNFYGPKDRRNTRDDGWKQTTLSLTEWINGDRETWGLAIHPVAKAKGGPSFCPSINLDGVRKDTAVTAMTALAVDVDSGTSLDHVLGKLEQAGVFAIVYTTFNHGSVTLTLKHDEVVRKLGIASTPDLAQVKEYLTAHHGPYAPAFLEAVKIKDARHQTAEGMRIVLDVPAIDKFRVVVPLDTPVKLAGLAPTMEGYKEVWANAVTGFCVNVLDTAFDVTSTDINRLFYGPAHAAGGAFYSAIVMGQPLRFEDIKPYSKARYVAERKAAGDPFLAGTQADVETFIAPSGADLGAWHRKHKERFLIADVLETYCSDKLRNAGGEKAGSVHVECPFEHEHSSSGGTATMAMNCDASEKGFWTVFYKHDACQGRNKLAFLEAMLAEQWFDESVLTDDGFLLPGDDEEESLTTISVEKATEGFSVDSSDADIRAYLKEMIEDGADTSSLNRAKDSISSKTALGMRDLAHMIKTINSELHVKTNTNKFGDPFTVNIGDGYLPVIAATTAILTARNEIEPLLFCYMEQLAEVRTTNGARVRILSKEGLSEVVSRAVKYVRTQKIGDDYVDVSTAPPHDEIANIFQAENVQYTLPLRGVVSAPFFDKDANLITTRGYHAESQVYYAPPVGLNLDRVSDAPSEDEVAESLRLIVEEVLADFPFGGFSRADIVQRCQRGGAGVPAVANLVGMTLLFFMREMIDGATPLHLFNKPMPGTGASLLSDVCHRIGTGEAIQSQAMPPNKEELAKTLSATLSESAMMVMFDNVNHSVDSAELANAITATVYKARVLGETRMAKVDVRNIWAITANHIALSAELTRRSVLIDMDAHHAMPEERSGWRHENIRAYVQDNRSALVHACLTLVQHWIAEGRQPYSGKRILGSFEEYVRNVGGVLEAAGLAGFLDNADQLKEDVADAGTDGLALFLTELATYPEGTVLRPGSDAGGATSIMAVLNAGCDDTGGRPITIEGWGYSKEDGTYQTSGAIGRKFAQLAKRPHRVTCDGVKVEILFEAQTVRSGTKAYTLRKRFVEA